jgi:hypothetical protein
MRVQPLPVQGSGAVRLSAEECRGSVYSARIGLPDQRIGVYTSF